jgi:hypothetical protein
MFIDGTINMSYIITTMNLNNHKLLFNIISPGYNWYICTPQINE